MWLPWGTRVGLGFLSLNRTAIGGFFAMVMGGGILAEIIPGTGLFFATCVLVVVVVVCVGLVVSERVRNCLVSESRAHFFRRDTFVIVLVVIGLAVWLALFGFQERLDLTQVNDWT